MKDSLRRVEDPGRYLHDVLQSTADGILVVDEGGHVVLANRRFAEMWRIPDEILATGDDQRLLQFVVDQLRDPEAFLARVERLYTSTKEELDVLRFHDDRVFERFSAPLMTDGKLAGRVWSFRDVTDRARAERALRASEARFRALYNDTPVMLHSIDANGDIVEVSDYWLKKMGYERSEVVGRKASSFLTAESRRLARDVTIPRLMRDGRVADIHYQFVRADGEVIDTSLTAVARYDENGGFSHSLAVVVDVSDRKRADQERQRLEEQVRHAQKLESLGILAGGVAHDFNNLLVGILGNADLALKNAVSDPRARQHLARIVVSAERAADLCQQMLAYSGKGTFVVQPVELSAIVREMVGLLEASISKRVTIRCVLADSPPTVEGDPTQLRQVVMNLITNAAEGIGERSGTIVVGTGYMDCDEPLLRRALLGENLEPGRYAFLEVRDDGVGMDTETQSRIFDPFFTSKSAGRGLGLAVTLGIVRGHGGAIVVHTAPDRGASFLVLLPISDRHAAIPTRGAEDGDRGTDDGVVLVVDDEEAVRLVAREALEDAGFAVLCAEHGLEAVRIYEERGEDIDLVLLDLTMPVLDGEETLRALRQIDPDVLVLLSSGFDRQTTTRRFRDGDIAGFVPKPYRARDLCAGVREALGYTAARGPNGAP